MRTGFGCPVGSRAGGSSMISPRARELACLGVLHSDNKEGHGAVVAFCNNSCCTANFEALSEMRYTFDVDPRRRHAMWPASRSSATHRIIDARLHFNSLAMFACFQKQPSALPAPLRRRKSRSVDAPRLSKASPREKGYGNDGTTPQGLLGAHARFLYADSYCGELPSQ